jgi:hypothetical protein
MHGPHPFKFRGVLNNVEESSFGYLLDWFDGRKTMPIAHHYYCGGFGFVIAVECIRWNPHGRVVGTKATTALLLFYQKFCLRWSSHVCHIICVIMCTYVFSMQSSNDNLELPNLWDRIYVYTYSLCFKIKNTFGHKLRYEIKVTFGKISLKLRQTNWIVARNNVNLVVDKLPSQIIVYTCSTIDIWARRRWRTSTWFYALWCHPSKMAGF